MVHAAARVAPILIAQVKLVVLGHKTQTQDVRLQSPVARCSPFLASIRLKFVDENAQRRTRLTTIAIRPIGKHAAAAKTLRDEVRIQIVLNQVAGRGDLRSRLSVRQITAGIRCCRIKLQGLQWKVIELRHALWSGEGSS